MDKTFNPFEFLTTPWGALPIGAAMPGANAFNMTDLREMDKRIAELKAVEQWLNLNLNLLRTTIQGLEVQRGTLAAIQTFSESFAKASGGATGQDTSSGQAQAANPFAGAAMPGSDQAAAWWDSMQKQFTQMMQVAQASAQSMVQPTSSESSGSETSGGTARPTN